jgi:malonate-semialdehyde dehydrogenase (acetylating)/methylmalonate-semialdehyde dehydrogenase
MANTFTHPYLKLHPAAQAREIHHWINGADHGGGGGPEIKILSPYTGQPMAKITSANKAMVDEAMDNAAKVQVDWGQLPIKERTAIMFRFRDELVRHHEQISVTKSFESGKTVAEGAAGLNKGIEVLEYALSLQNLDAGGRMEVSRGVHCEYRRIPLGVVAGVTPFNFPAMVPMWMIPIALTLGNAFVWKPSDKTPMTSLLIADCLKRAGLPAGVFTVLQGGRETVEAILDHPKLTAVGFVGSTPVAKEVYRRATGHMKRALCLGGAKNHVILLPDADPAVVAQGVRDSFTGCAGQRCMAASVLLAVGPVDHLIEKVVAKTKELRLGFDMGAIITKGQVEFLEKAITQAEKDGAKILLDGRRARMEGEFEGGNWIGPTILDNVKPGSEAATKELFGPILSIVRCRDLSEALRIEASVDYGNATSVFTTNGAAAEEVARRATCAMVGVNIGVPVPREPFSFGGIFESKFGAGDITGEHSLDFWSNMKKITMKWAVQKDSNWMS